MSRLTEKYGKYMRTGDVVKETGLTRYQVLYRARRGGFRGIHQDKRGCDYLYETEKIEEFIKNRRKP